MKKIIASIYCLSFLAVFGVQGQEQQQTIPKAPAVFYESLGDGWMRFYFDERYYLTDINCHFLSIERDAQYDLVNNQFHGEFKDFDSSGRLILKGNYKEGLKEGLFEAFHNNGQLKWTVNYIEDQVDGTWMYYYPDGKPMLELFYGDRGMEIVNYWNVKGEKKVNQKEGRYEMKVEIDGYSEYGADFVNRKGRVRNGKPTGNWSLELVYPDQKMTFLGADTYREGRIIPEDNGLDELIRGHTRYSVVPQLWFLRAEDMISKNCTIDEQTGFIDYLAHHLESWFEGMIDQSFEARQIVYDLEVDKEGNLKKITPVQTFDERSAVRYMGEVISEVGFWFPSFSEGEYIDDILRVSFEMFPDIEKRKARVFSVQIEREKGY